MSVVVITVLQFNMKSKRLRDRSGHQKQEQQEQPAPKKAKREQSGTENKTREPVPELLKWLLGIPEKRFFSEVFEKCHHVVSHGSTEYFTKPSVDGIPSVDWTTARMIETVEKHTIHFGTDISVVRFDPKLKQRVTYKSEGVVSSAELQKCMKEGWSVRFLRPHEFIASNSAFISILEEKFNCYCGLNSYWTPANSQGFAPHFDDVDVFLLQIEGEKEWRLYDPLDEVGVLTRHSSEDYVPEQFPTPMYSLTLKAGDVLYMPRGMVHQGRTTPKTHSLHVTFSANQMNSWADFFLSTSRYTIESLAANRLEWRQAIPRNLLHSVGEVHNPEFREGCGLDTTDSASTLELRAQFQGMIREKINDMTLLLLDATNLDICADVYAKSAISKMQPLPSLASMGKKKNEMAKAAEVSPHTKVRMVRRNCARLLLNVDGEAQVFHCAGNSPVCLQTEVDELRFESDFAPAIATLVSVYPNWTRVADLPFPAFDVAEDVEENQLLLVETLRDAKILEVGRDESK